MLRNIGSIVFGLQLLASVGFAATPLLPIGKNPSPAECGELAKQLYSSELITSFTSMTQVSNFICQESRVLQILEQVGNYQKAAAAKRDPFTINVYSKNGTAKVELNHSYEQKVELENISYDSYEAFLQDIDHKPAQAVTNALRKKLIENLILVSNGPNIKSLVAAVANTQQNKKLKEQIFKAGSPIQQIQMIRKLADEDQFNEHFAPERLGLSGAEDFGLNRIIEFSNDLARAENSIPMLFGFLLHYELHSAKNFDYDDFSNELFEGHSSFVSFYSLHKEAQAVQIQKALGKDFSPQLAKLAEASLQRFQKRFFKGVQPIDSSERVPHFKIIGVPPYLGVYRGCVSGDCSTSSSWAFPYSPHEHIFYIVKDGKNLGYISLTETTIKNKKNIYLKDLAGENLSAEIAEQALHAMFMAHKEFKVSTMSIASNYFTSRENHKDAHIDMLAKYNDGNRKNKTVEQKFPDAKWRERIAEGMGVSLIYDNVDYHKDTVLFKPNTNVLEKLEVEIVESPDFLSQEPMNPEDLETAINRYLGGDTSVLNEITFASKKPFQELMTWLTADRKAKYNLAAFYENVEYYLNELGLQLSAKLKKENAHWFTRGHLGAQDAVSSPNKALNNAGFRMISRILREAKDLSQLDGVLQNKENLKLVMADSRFQNDVALFVKRNQYNDWRRLYYLDYFEIPEVRAYFENEQNLTTGFSATLADEVKDEGDENALENGLLPILYIQENVALLRKALLNEDKLKAADFFRNLGKVTADFFVPEELLKTPEMFSMISYGFLQSPDFAKSRAKAAAEWREEIAERLLGELSKDDLDLPDDMVFLLIELYENKTSKAIHKRFEKHIQSLYDKTANPYIKAYMGSKLIQNSKTKVKFTKKDLSLIASALDNEKSVGEQFKYGIYAVHVLENNSRLLSEEAIKELVLTAKYDDDPDTIVRSAFIILTQHKKSGKVSKKDLAKIQKRFVKYISKSTLTQNTQAKMLKKLGVKTCDELLKNNSDDEAA